MKLREAPINAASSVRGARGSKRWWRAGPNRRGRRRMRAGSGSVRPGSRAVLVLAVRAHHVFQRSAQIGTSSISAMHRPDETTPSCTAPDSSAARQRAPASSGSNLLEFAAAGTVLVVSHPFGDHVAGAAERRASHLEAGFGRTHWIRLPTSFLNR